MDRIFVENSIGTLVQKVQAKEISSDELLKAAFQNIAELDPKYHAWVCDRGDTWVSPGRGSVFDGYHTPESLFRGIPIGVKDIYNTYDFPTQMGSPLWKGHMSGNDARTVYNLKHEGAVVIGKTVTAEFAVHALESTLNPWDISKTPGTSSSGSAVAVSTGMVPFATGSQTAGSIIRPSSFTGVYGFKPSFGLLPRTGTLKTTDSLDTLGFMSIYLEDLRRGLDAMRVRGLDYPMSDRAINDNTRRKQSGRPWKIAFAKTHVWGHAPQYAKDAIEKFVDALAGFKEIEVVDAALPPRAGRSHSIHETIYNKSLSYYFRGEHKSSDFVSVIMNQMIENGKTISIESYKAALEEQLELIDEMDTYLSDIDIMLSLSTSGEAPSRDMTELPDPSLIWTLSHLPAISVPQFTSPAGLPFGFQATARKYNDYLLVDFLDTLRGLDLIPASGGFAVHHN